MALSIHNPQIMAEGNIENSYSFRTSNCFTLQRNRIKGQVDQSTVPNFPCSKVVSSYADARLVLLLGWQVVAL